MKCIKSVTLYEPIQHAMTASAMRKELYQAITYIKDTDFLKAVYTIVTSKIKEENYTRPGKPMSISEYRKRIKKSEASIEAGEYMTQEQLEKEMEKW